MQNFANHVSPPAVVCVCVTKFLLSWHPSYLLALVVRSPSIMGGVAGIADGVFVAGRQRQLPTQKVFVLFVVKCANFR